MTRRNNSKAVKADEAQDDKTATSSVSTQSAEKEKTPQAPEAKTQEGSSDVQQNDQAVTSNDKPDDDSKKNNVVPGRFFSADELEKMYKEDGVDPEAPFPFVVLTKTKQSTHGFWRGGKQHFPQETTFEAGAFTYDSFRRVLVEPHVMVQVVKQDDVG